MGTYHKKKRAKKPPVQRCYFWARQFLSQIDCTSAEANILLALAGFANPDGTSIRPGNLRLVRVTKLSERSIQRAIKFWRERGVLVLDYPGNGKNHAAVFHIDMAKGVTESPFPPLKGDMETPFARPKGDKSTLQRVTERVSGWHPTESPNRPKEDETGVSSSSDDDALVKQAVAILKSELPDWEDWQLEYAVESIVCNAFNFKRSPHSSGYYVTGVRDLSAQEVAAIRGSSEATFRAWQAHNRVRRREIATEREEQERDALP